MGSVEEFLFNVGGGETKFSLVSCTNDQAYETLLAPSSGKKVAITKLVVSPPTTGANGTCTIGFFDEGSGSPDTYIFNTLGVNGFASPIVMDFEGCPIVGAVDQTLKARKDTGTGNAVRINFTGYEF